MRGEVPNRHHSEFGRPLTSAIFTNQINNLHIQDLRDRVQFVVENRPSDGFDFSYLGSGQDDSEASQSSAQILLGNAWTRFPADFPKAAAN